MRGNTALLSHNKPNSFATVVVLPVPGPPLMSIKACNSANAAARCCPAPPASANHSAKFCAACIQLISATGACAKRTISAAKSCSSCHIRPKNKRRPNNISGVSPLLPTIGCAVAKLAASASLNQINEWPSSKAENKRTKKGATASTAAIGA